MLARMDVLRRIACLLRWAWLPLTLAGCAAFAPPVQPGASEADALARLGAPTARYTMPDGTTRLEFARGPFGRETWMVDVDAGARVQRAEQVLNEASFATLVPGLTRGDVLRRLGRPAEAQRVGWLGREVWSWRYPTNDCLWFRVTFEADGRLLDAGGYMPDPMCDPPSDWQ